MIEPLPDLLIAPIVRAALAEDLGRAGDVTAQACIPAEARLSAVFATRKPGVISGLACARRIAAPTPPAAATWLSLIRIASSRPKRWLTPPPQRTAYFSSARKPGVVLRVSVITAPVPATAST